MRITKTKIASVVAATAVVALGGTAAMAYWTTTGSGDGTANTDTSKTINVVFDSPLPSLLSPTTTRTINFHLNNTALFPQYVHNVQIAVQNSDLSAWTVGSSAHPCTAADFTITQPAAINAEVPAGVSGAYTASITMIDLPSTDQGDCKSISSVPLHATLS